MDSLFRDLSAFFTTGRLQTAIRILIVLIGGFIVLRLILVILKKALEKRLSQQISMLLKKAVYYTGFILILIIVLQQLGFKLTALLGAAGIAGVAIGFAAQTSLSNLISGLFLISEKPFQMGDLIKIGDTLGIVLSIDLLSVKIRTFDNQYIRIPNEKLLNTELVNVTRFPIRRLDLNLNVAYKSDVDQVKTVLADIAQKNPYCLDEPAPLIVFNNFGDSALEFFLGVWFYKTDYLDLKNSIMQEIKERFEVEGIEIPFPHRSIYTGSLTEPFPVSIVPAAGSGERGPLEPGLQSSGPEAKS